MQWTQHWCAPRHNHTTALLSNISGNICLTTCRVSEILQPQELLTFDNARNCFHLGRTEFDSLPSDMHEACDLLDHFGALVYAMPRAEPVQSAVHAGRLP